MLQILLTAVVYSYCLLWLYEKGIDKRIWLIMVMIYTLYPFLNIIMVNIFKDIPFSLLILMWIPLLYEFWKSKGEILQNAHTMLLICLLLLFSLLRNNGVYVSAFLIFCMFITYPSRWKSYIALSGVLVVVIFASHGFEKKNHITHLFKETVGIPLQQMAGVVYYNGKIDDEQLQFIEQVIPVKFIKENYNPYSADKLKWGGAPLDNAFLDNHKKEFM
ncbi:MAG: DUF6020 family protein [Lachnospiraceae bacterium]|nr:DUF6020 family protein [Lachnospiraceae bacterium]